VFVPAAVIKVVLGAVLIASALQMFKA